MEKQLIGMFKLLSVAPTEIKLVAQDPAVRKTRKATVSKALAQQLVDWGAVGNSVMVEYSLLKAPALKVLAISYATPGQCQRVRNDG